MTFEAVRLRWAHLSDFDGRIDDFEARLPAVERERAQRFKVAVARDRFVLARSLLRRVLGDTLDDEPKHLRFAAGDHGKPHLIQPKPPPAFGFNLSHSGQSVVLAVASCDVGVDVEHLRPMTTARRLARRFFSADEEAVVLASDAAVRDRAFFRIWTQKEAYLKAIGIGVGMPLREVETEPDPTRPPRLLAISGDRDEGARWSLIETDIRDAVCVVAIRGATPNLDVRRINPEDLA